MRIAVLSDIHGNHIALNECLKHAKGQNVDRYVFLGDYLGEFPYQQKTMEMLYELNDKEKCLFIRGNKEDYWLDRKKNVNCEWINGNSSVGVMKYNFENINDKDFAFFEAMPISKNIEIEGMPSILFCHGTPISNSAKLLPDNDTTDELLKNIPENYIVCGHTHIQRSFFSGEKRIINDGAVGVALSGKGRVAQYMILDSSSGEWNVETFDVEYDVEKVKNEIYESGLFDVAPYWCRITIHLMETGTISHGTVLNEATKHNDFKDDWFNIPDVDWEAALDAFNIK